MVQLDWLRQMRYARRPAFARSQRHDSFVALGMAEVLEPRCVLSSVMSFMPVDDVTDDANSTNLDDLTSDDVSGLDCPPDDEKSQESFDATTYTAYSFDGGEAANFALDSMGPFAVDSGATSPYFSDADLHDHLLNLAKQQWGGLFGQTIPQYQYYNWWRGIDYLMVDDAIAMEAPPPKVMAAASSRVTSDTNTQVSGVDEADFVETDGRYIYVARGGGLTIFDTADQLSSVSELALSGNVVGEFLSGDRLTVITQSGYGGGWYGGISPLVRVADFAGSFAPGRWNPQTTVTVFDVSDRSAPSIASQTTLDGNFRDARAVNGTVYVVLENSFNLPEPLYTDAPAISDETEVVITDPVEEEPLVVDAVSEKDNGESSDAISFIVGRPVRWGWWNPTIIANRTYESFDDYVARVGDQLTNLSLPHAYSVGADGSTTDLGPLTSAENIVRPHSDNQQSLLTVVSIDAANASADSGVASSAGLMTSYGSTVYMTHDALYVATTEYHYDQLGSSTDTRIDRFSVDGTNVTWQACGVVPGTLLNQFAMDEQRGYLHVATHTWAQHWVPSDSPDFTNEAGAWANGHYVTQNENGVYVLDMEGDTLDEVGSVTGLAPGEQLYAARFIGDMAYLVTFLQTDPLFAIDLSDPANPTLQGELVIPGFSNYLQSVGEGLLLGIGQEREAGTWHSRLHVSLFDVADGTNLTQIARQFLDESAQWSSSDAQYDHHALLYSAEDGLLVLPVNGSGFDKESGNYYFEQLLAVLHIDANGIEVLGEIHSSQAVFRTLRIDNVLYAVSESGVTAYSLEDFSAIGQANLFNALPWYYPIAYATGGGVLVQRGNAGDPDVVNLSDGADDIANTAVANPPMAMSIAMISTPVGGDGFSSQMSITAMASQVAQNSANNLGRLGAPVFASNAGFGLVDQNSTRDGLASSNSLDSSRSDQDQRSEGSSESSNDKDAPSFDAFWQEFTKRLRDGKEPMPMEDSAPSNSDTPMNADKDATKTEVPNARSATEKQGNARTPEMSQRVRPAQRGSAVIVPVRAVTKTAAVKLPIKTQPAR